MTAFYRRLALYAAALVAAVVLLSAFTSAVSEEATLAERDVQEQAAVATARDYYRERRAVVRAYADSLLDARLAYIQARSDTTVVRELTFAPASVQALVGRCDAMMTRTGEFELHVAQTIAAADTALAKDSTHTATLEREAHPGLLRRALEKVKAAPVPAALGFLLGLVIARHPP